MALELTGIPFEAHDLLPGLHGLIVRAQGFPAWTVPALRIDGRRVQGTLAIARELDRLAPRAGLFPREAEQRGLVEHAERFGHDELQPIARRVFRWAGACDNTVRAWMAKEVVGAPAPKLAGYAFKPVMMFFGRVISKADDSQVRDDLARLPRLMDHADTLIEAGTIGGEAPNAADLQILTSIRLLMAHEDLRPAIAPRPCGQAALRLIPDYPRSGPDALPPVPAALPPEWLPPVPPAPGQHRQRCSEDHGHPEPPMQHHDDDVRNQTNSAKENTMELYAILRRSGWRAGAELEQAAARSTKVGNEQMADDVRWIRSYVLEETGGSVGTVCIYEATSPAAIRQHASLADLPVDEIIRIADTVVVRPDPQLSSAETPFNMVLEARP
jgi:glutathione S-transferase